MAHTTLLEQYVFLHAGDFRGTVTIKNPDSGQTIDIPIRILEDFVAECIRHRQIAALEGASTGELLVMLEHGAQPPMAEGAGGACQSITTSTPYGGSGTVGQAIIRTVDLPDQVDVEIPEDGGMPRFGSPRK